MKVLVCGGRNYSKVKFAYDTLDEIHNTDCGGAITTIIQGGATGADTIARLWASRKGIPNKEFKADWKIYGKAAGALRNQKMLDEGRPDLVVAFPGGSGTADMVARTRKAGIPLRIIEESEIDANKTSEDL
jgi:hypothetical protein